MNFVAIDFETAISHHICSVGIVTVENDRITDEYYSLIKPPGNYYHWRNTQVHGITEQDTKNAADFKVVYPEIKKRLYGKTIVAHNESFDRNVLIKTMNDYHIPYSDLNIANQWQCTLKMYRAKGYKPANLHACCQQNNIELQHHEALSDARACAKLYLLNR